MVGGLRRLTGALAVLLLVSGCATAISGSPRPAPDAGKTGRSTPASARPATDTAAGLLGELTTIDPCSLTDTKDLSSFGTVEVGEPDSLDDCLIEIKTSAPVPVALYVGGLDRSESWPEINVKRGRDLANGLKVVEYDTDDTYCNHLVVFPDGITLSVNASIYEGTERRLCDIVTSAVDTAVEAIKDGDVRHRDYARNSLGRIDPCELVPDAAVAAVPGLGTSVRPKDYPAEHGCAWTAADNSVRLRVMFIAGQPPKPTGEGAGESQVAGRASVLSPTPEAGAYVFCGQQTGHIAFRAEGQSGLVEIAAVFVRMKEGQIDAACKAATDVATLVWPKLPRT
ncbi:MAG TPA: hypothetical protein VFV67_05310 [Actinophytocola sp.]|uniref:hypothetical protein n=1 Tax=Actinophytocola sp. TaxID=1872138 RepID=UPI002DB8990A|nr:hypothetical protein [Actinophytocola sp.]HEU5470051.1 hypothetical protein [Actinophytocola sp.]